MMEIAPIVMALVHTFKKLKMGDTMLRETVNFAMEVARQVATPLRENTASRTDRSMISQVLRYACDRTGSGAFSPEANCELLW